MRRLILWTTALALLAGPASAQTRVFVSGALFGDVKQPSEGGDFLERDNTAFGGGVRVGAFLSDRWSVELGVDIGGDTSQRAGYRALIEALAGQYSQLSPGTAISILPIYDFKETTRLTATSVLIGYHPATSGRWHPGFAGGLTFVREVTQAGRGGYPISLDLRIAPLEYVRNGPAATVAFEVAIDVTRRLSVVPEVRAHAYEGTTVFRPGAAVRWELR